MMQRMRTFFYFLVVVLLMATVCSQTDTTTVFDPTTVTTNSPPTVPTTTATESTTSSSTDSTSSSSTDSTTSDSDTTSSSTDSTTSSSTDSTTSDPGTTSSSTDPTTSVPDTTSVTSDPDTKISEPDTNTSVPETTVIHTDTTVDTSTNNIDTSDIQTETTREDTTIDDLPQNTTVSDVTTTIDTPDTTVVQTATEIDTTEVTGATEPPKDCEGIHKYDLKCFPNAPWLVEGKEETVERSSTFKAVIGGEADIETTGSGKVTFVLSRENDPDIIRTKFGDNSEKLSEPGVWLILVEGNFTIKMVVEGNLQPPVDVDGSFFSYLEGESERIVEARFSDEITTQARQIIITRDNFEGEVKVSVSSSDREATPKLYSTKDEKGVTTIVVHPCADSAGTLYIFITSDTDPVEFSVGLKLIPIPKIPANKMAVTAEWGAEEEIVLTFSEVDVFENYRAYTEEGVLGNSRPSICDMIVGKPIEYQANKRAEFKISGLSEEASHIIYLIGNSASGAYAAYNAVGVSERGSETSDTGPVDAESPSEDDDNLTLIIILVVAIVAVPLIILGVYFLWRHFKGDGGGAFKDTELDYMFVETKS